MEKKYSRQISTEVEKYNVKLEGFPKGGVLDSFPMGGGDCGANVWMEEDGALHLLLSKTDSFAESGRLMKIGHVKISTQPQLFSRDNPPLMELHLLDGHITVEDKKGEAKITLAAFVDLPLIGVEIQSRTPAAVSLSHENYRTGTRVLHHGDPSAYCYSGAKFEVRESADLSFPQPDALAWCHYNQWSYVPYTLLNQHLSEFIGEDPIRGRCFGCVALGDGFSMKDGTLSAPAKTGHQLFLSLSCGQYPSPDEWLRAARQEALRLSDMDFHGLLRKNAQWWTNYFTEYYLRVSGDKEAETVMRGYTLQKYMNGCAGRGRMPIKFNGSIFTVHPSPYDQSDLDYRLWGDCYWIQNTRLVYWNMLYSGDFEGMLPFFRLCRGLIPISKARVKNLFGHGGMLLPETFTFYGAYADSNFGFDQSQKEDAACVNRYIGWHYNGQVEISYLMLKYVEYTGDREFLKETAVPFCQETLTFFREHFPKVDGVYRLYPVSSLETWQDCVDDTPDLAGLRAVCGRLREFGVTPALDDENLAEIPYWEKKGKTVVSPCRAFVETQTRNCENPELYPLFPYETFHLGSGEQELAILRDTFALVDNPHTHGWSQMLAQGAMLGDTAYCKRVSAASFGEKNPDCFFPAYWGPNFDWTPDQDHGNSTAVGVVMMALQSHGGKDYFLPAWPEEWEVSFRLPLPGGRTAQADYRGGALVNKEIQKASL